MRKRGKRRFGLKELMLLVVTLVACLIAGEIVVRLVHPWPKFVKAIWPVRAVGWTYKPGLRTYSTNHWREYVIPLDINGLGFRDVEPRPAPQGRAIVFLGDSFVAAQEVFRNKRWTELVTRTLSRLAGRTITSYNLGCQGYGPTQYWLVYRRFAKGLSHRLVVVFVFASNDFTDCLPRKGAPYLKKVGNGKYSLVLPTKSFVLQQRKKFGLRWYKRLHLYNLQRDLIAQWRVKRRWKRLRQKWDGSWDGFWKLYCDKFQVITPVYKPMPNRLIISGRGPMTESLHRLKRLVEKRGARLLAVVLPHRRVYAGRRGRNDALAPGLDKILKRLDYTLPARTAVDVLNKLGIDHLDLTPVLIKMGPAARKLTWPKDAHFNARGNVWLARQVLAELARRSAAKWLTK